MNTNPFIDALSSIPEQLRFPAFVLLFVGALTYLFVVDIRRNKTLGKVVDGNNRMMGLSVKINDNLSDQYQLILVLLRRYSDNLSNEQLPTFVMLVYKNLEVRLLKIYMAVKRDFDADDLSLEAAEKRMRKEGANLYKITMQVIITFKYRGQPISKGYCFNDYMKMVDECVLKLNRIKHGYEIQRSLETIVDELTVITTDKLLMNDKDV